MTRPRVDLSKYIVISIWFGCNNDCRICMLSGLKSTLPPIGFEGFKRVLREIVDHGRFENLILSGAEVTTFEDLERYVRFAASLDWFRKIQIQTNGRRLSDERYLRHLVECGVNEFFVSIHGHEEVHDGITRRRGAFRQLMEGLDNLEALDVNVISNTVLTKSNLRDIPRLMSTLSERGISEMQLWNYFPMERQDTEDLVVGMREFQSLLTEVLDILRPTGKPLVLKSLPECLSRGEPGFFDSLFPVTILPDRFWREFSECGFGACVYRDVCEARECWGLSSAYIRKYGDERGLLSPMTGRAFRGPMGES